MFMSFDFRYHFFFVMSHFTKLTPARLACDIVYNICFQDLKHNRAHR